ncbi:hypothetical protein KKD52_04420 [Myxococcota bacterium]|nr:hypothetical protein [Myxococcota bacterium]MBU1413769.1 hypothetical protein [Myxococcota bacterium]MBU1509588.1 hypothetical protein [Myxococcota bacterium]
MRKRPAPLSPGSPPYEIIAPMGVSPQQLITPDGPEVLMLLSGRMHMQVPTENHSMEMKYGRPVVVEKPYCVFCPHGPGTGRALRISVPSAAGPLTDAPSSRRKPALH